MYSRSKSERRMVQQIRVFPPRRWSMYQPVQGGNGRNGPWVPVGCTGRMLAILFVLSHYPALTSGKSVLISPLAIVVIMISRWRQLCEAGILEGCSQRTCAHVHDCVCVCVHGRMCAWCMNHQSHNEVLGWKSPTWTAKKCHHQFLEGLVNLELTADGLILLK